MQIGALKTTATHELAKSQRLNEENDEMKSIIDQRNWENWRYENVSINVRKKRARNAKRFVHGWYGEEIEERKFQISYNTDEMLLVD